MDWIGMELNLTLTQAYQERRAAREERRHARAYSSGQWLTPLRQGMKSMAMGAMRVIGVRGGFR
jgi:hypothetical protein